MEGHFLFFTLRTMCMDGAMETIGDSFEAAFTLHLDWHTTEKNSQNLSPMDLKTGTSLPLLAEYWQLSSSRKLNYSRRRYNISMQGFGVFKKAYASDSVCFHDKINFLEVAITKGSEAYHSTRTLSPGVYRCFIPTK